MWKIICVCAFTCISLFVPALRSVVYPLQFSIPECKIVQEIPEKDRDFAFLIPGYKDTYIYYDESVYYRDYQRAYYAITRKKGGWDCLRHYEILASGCIPYFVGLENCDDKTMFALPKKLILEAMHLRGVSYLKIDHKRFDKTRYYQILNELLAYTRQHLTTRAMAQYMLDTIGYSGKGKVLFLGKSIAPDYLRCLTLVGLREVLGDRLIDAPKIPHIYKSFSPDLVGKLYGCGFTYTRILDDVKINRENIEQRIKNKEFEIIIYGSVHRGCPYLDLVCKTYDKNKIFYICGEDAHQCNFAKDKSRNLFLREFGAAF